jgi:hypothetical protein
MAATRLAGTFVGVRVTFFCKLSHGAAPPLWLRLQKIDGYPFCLHE